MTPNDEGETISLPSGVTASVGGSPVSTVYVGQVSSTQPAALTAAQASTPASDTTPADQVSGASFKLVDSSGDPVTLSQAVTNGTFTLGGETPANDPLYDAFDGTTGGGDTGAIVLSKDITGGTVSNDYYNHYSMLRTLEDIFQVVDRRGEQHDGGERWVHRLDQREHRAG